MKLLITTQKVDQHDPVLGFFHRWIEEFAKQYEKVLVVCLYEGSHALPPNVLVFSLGKETGVSRIKYIRRFWWYIWKLRHDYDRVFVHMNVEYMILGGLLWRALGKKTMLSYIHRQVHLKLRIAEKFANVVVSAAPESFRLPSKKLHIIGHGVDTDRFKFTPHDTWSNNMVSVGRITPIKNLDVLLEAMTLLRDEHAVSKLQLIGDIGVSSDAAYKNKLVQYIQAKDLGSMVTWVGSVPNQALPALYENTDISINLTPPGGIDKVVLEAMASGVIPVVSNTAFRPFFGMFANDLIFAYRNASDLVGKITEIISSSKKSEIRAYLRSRVEKEASIPSIVGKIIALL